MDFGTDFGKVVVESGRGNSRHRVCPVLHEGAIGEPEMKSRKLEEGMAYSIGRRVGTLASTWKPGSWWRTRQ